MEKQIYDLADDLAHLYDVMYEKEKILQILHQFGYPQQ